MLEYYNNTTNTLILPYDYSEELKDIPKDTKILIFNEDILIEEYSIFNQEIKENVLPETIKNLTLFSHNNLINNLPIHIDELHINFSVVKEYNKEVSNLPFTLQKIIINNKKFLKYITKKPFGCEIVIQKN